MDMHKLNPEAGNSRGRAGLGWGHDEWSSGTSADLSRGDLRACRQLRLPGPLWKEALPVLCDSVSGHLWCEHLRDCPTLEPEWLRQLTATTCPLRPPWMLAARASPRESGLESLQPAPGKAGISAPWRPLLRAPRGAGEIGGGMGDARGCRLRATPTPMPLCHSPLCHHTPGPKEVPTHSDAHWQGHSTPETRHIHSYS